jgi:hypothetical protein
LFRWALAGDLTITSTSGWTGHRVFEKLVPPQKTDILPVSVAMTVAVVVHIVVVFYY